MATEAQAPADRGALCDLVAEVAGFYVRDRRLRRAQARITELLAKPEEVPGDEVRAYLAEVRRYFSGFEREARVHLGNLERRLAAASQLQFNLMAERGVAVKRVEVTQGVLTRVAEIAGG